MVACRGMGGLASWVLLLLTHWVADSAACRGWPGLANMFANGELADKVACSGTGGLVSLVLLLLAH